MSLQKEVHEYVNRRRETAPTRLRYSQPGLLVPHASGWEKIIGKVGDSDELAVQRLS
ncbi:hypothetical protein LJR034_007544 [Caballeronia sp. LjRoot34]|uniref:hypothetical protein n=1 Tax=Caballeronia sp. LjRoot34 TaxID=3342325 RepID=UPI003ECD662A